MTPHTPGPWRSENGIVLGGLERAEFRRGKFYPQVALALSGDATPEERTANAALIAAAPELAEALAELVALDDGDEPMAWKHAHLFHRGRVALEKAGLL